MVFLQQIFVTIMLTNSPHSLILTLVVNLILQVELVRSLEVRDDQYKKMLDEKLHLADDSGLIQAYSQEFGNRLAS